MDCLLPKKIYEISECLWKDDRIQLSKKGSILLISWNSSKAIQILCPLCVEILLGISKIVSISACCSTLFTLSEKPGFPNSSNETPGERFVKLSDRFLVSFFTSSFQLKSSFARILEYFLQKSSTDLILYRSKNMHVVDFVSRNTFSTKDVLPNLLGEKSHVEYPFLI